MSHGDVIALCGAIVGALLMGFGLGWDRGRRHEAAERERKSARRALWR